MLVFIFWLICAAAAVAVAEHKGRSGCAFAIVALITAPIALIIALVMQPTEAVITKRAIASGDLRECPACKEAIKASATICPNCRTESRPE